VKRQWKKYSDVLETYAIVELRSCNQPSGLLLGLRSTEDNLLVQMNWQDKVANITARTSLL
jgi:hypothetical protein